MPPFTYRELVLMPEDGKRHELIDGDLFVTPSTRERDQHWKSRLYERFGVPEYWIVDPDMGQIEAHAMLDARYGLRARYHRGSTLECPLFPGLAVGLMKVFDRER